jgi:hypothetical protein
MNVMKKMIFSFLFVTSAFFAMATEKSVQPDCSVTMKGMIDLGPIAVEVSCTTTASTCDQATSKALTCLKSAMTTMRTIIL